MKDITVLSTACGAMFMPGFFKCLKYNNERHIRIIGTDIIGDKSMELLVDKFYKVPPISDEKYIDIIIEICKREGVNIVFPQISMELPLYFKRINDFEKNDIHVAITKTDSLFIANNKLKLYEFMNQNGLDTPKFLVIKNKHDLLKAASYFGYPYSPFCVKVSESSGSRGVRIIWPNLSKSDMFLHEKPNSLKISLAEMISIIDEFDFSEHNQIFAMQYVSGCEYTVDLLAEEGKTLLIAGRRNTNSSLSIAHNSVIEHIENAYNICKLLVSLLKLDGNIGFDFMLAENDEPILTDLNPRITATIVLYAAAGINFPYLRIKQLLGEPLPHSELKYGVKITRKFDDIFYDDNNLLTPFPK